MDLFRNLVFEGGGVKGIAYIGALEVMEEKDILGSVKRFGGVSAGAIFAALVAIGYTSAEIRKEALELDFTQFINEDTGVFNEIKDAGRLLKKFGWFSGDYFNNWIEELIEKKIGKPGATFRDLKENESAGDLYVCTTNLSTGFGEVMSFENTPDSLISDALRASMSIPFFFASTNNERGDVIVDGGVVNNYPIKLFDRRKYIENTECGLMGIETDYYKRANAIFLQEHPYASPYMYNKQTLGFHLDTPEQMGVYRDYRQRRTAEINNLLEFSKVLVRIVMNQLGNKHLHEDDWARSVFIDSLGVFTTELDLSEEKKTALVESGRTSMEKYLAWFENTENHPRNCPRRGIYQKKPAPGTNLS